MKICKTFKELGFTKGLIDKYSVNGGWEESPQCHKHVNSPILIDPGNTLCVCVWSPAAPQGTQDLSSSTRDGTAFASAETMESLTTRLPGKAPNWGF